MFSGTWGKKSIKKSDVILIFIKTIDKGKEKWYNKRGDKIMPKTYKISKNEAAEIKEQRKTISDKKTDKRLYAVQLRGEGYTNREIAEKLDTSDKMVSQWVSMYINQGGMEAILPKKRIGTHRNISYEEEAEFISYYKQEAEKGHIVDVKEIEAAYVQKVGHKISSAQIYRVLSRHGWRKIMPRSKHPQKANDEAINASKKLKL